MKDAISTPGMGAMGANGIVRALTGRSPMAGSGNKKSRAKLKKKVTSNKKKASRSKNGRRKKR